MIRTDIVVSCTYKANVISKVFGSAYCLLPPTLPDSNQYSVEDTKAVEKFYLLIPPGLIGRGGRHSAAQQIDSFQRINYSVFQSLFR